MNYQDTHPYYHELEVKSYKDAELQLIQPDLKYAEASLQWISNPEIVQYLGADFSNPSLEGEQKRIQEILENKDEYHWMIELNGKVIGNVNINSIAKISKKFGVKAGYPAILIGDKNYWRKGIGYHVMKTVLDWAFQEAGFEVIAARVLQENIASIRNLKKLGFEEDGTEPYDGLVKGKKNVWRKYIKNTENKFD
jgi:RimJ/RimL family protein N-acetyltransferase